MECKICGSKEIKGDCQYINGDYYHNHCIEQLEKENKELYNKIEKSIEYMEHYIKVEERKYNDNVMKEFEFVIKLLKGDVDEGVL